ncbi:hypothetical protein [Oryzomonas rubra]|uniref:Uncharacterized protein n=1 Tax=Oryzomonas rubra TaxID=2509454 RepID=A0A5A9X667_9BACT|nr:hypothetical protein [Oryzomonas rubra]KAA0888264.1 hypothetical protein ET418_16105 [Oryzomonas rubra]
MKKSCWGRSGHLLFLITWVTLLGLFFAMTEIQIEGANGWAASLPTWRIEKHWLLDLFWGGRAMTGYHAWVFSFMCLAFHLPHAIVGQITWRQEARCLGSLMLFWIIEDFLWFVMNPAYGIAHFRPQFIPWHKHWALGMPTDYLLFTVVGSLLLMVSFSGLQPNERIQL